MTITAPPRTAADTIGPAGSPEPPAAPRPRDRAGSDRPVHALTTLIGALAVLAGSSALSASISGSSWVLPLIEVVAVVWLVGIGGRLIRLPAAVTVLLQAAGITIALTALFTVDGYGGVIPNSDVLKEFGALLSGAWEQILGTAPPAPSTPELAFLVCLTVGVSAIIVDFLIAEAQAPALVALPLLCLYSVPASIATELLPWPAFVAPAALYALLLAVTGLEGRRRGARAGLGVAASGLAIVAIASVAALLVSDAMTAVGTEGRLPRSGSGSGEIGLSPFTSLRGNLERSDPVDMLQISGLPQAAYLRTAALQTWTPGTGFSPSALHADIPEIQGQLAPVAPGAELTRVTIDSVQFADKYLPLYGGAVAVSGLGPGWQYDRTLGMAFREDSENPGTYSVVTSFDLPTADELRADTVTPGGALTETGTLPQRVVTLAREITADADTAFDKSDALLNYFLDTTNGFTYSLVVPPGNTGDALTDFLDNKQGYCEQYASAMAVMLRSIGIPARVAVGFTQGTSSGDGTYTINSHDAHAWVEVLFDEHGWVQFDPTPLAGSTGGQQGFAGGTTAPEVDETTEVTETGTDDAPTISPGAGPQIDDDPLGTASPNLGAGTGSAADNPGSSAALWWILAVLAAIAAVVAAPSVIRNLRRKRRLAAAAAGGPGSGVSAWSEVEDLCLDHGIALRPSESARALANRIARTASLSDPARVQLRTLVVTAEREWYDADVSAEAAPDGESENSSAGDGGARSTNGSAKPAGAPAEGSGLVTAVEAVAAGLDRALPRSWQDRLVPRSVRPSARD